MELASHILKKNKVNLTKLPMKLEIEVLGTTPPLPPRMKIVQDFFLYFWAGQEFSDKSAPPPFPTFKNNTTCL